MQRVWDTSLESIVPIVYFYFSTIILFGNSKTIIYRKMLALMYRLKQQSDVANSTRVKKTLSEKMALPE